MFFTEMWERFSFYGLRALLIYYLTQHLLFDDSTASGQVAAYTTLVYLLPLVGGVIADRYLGNRKAVAIGALLLVLGHGFMVVQTPPAEQAITYHDASYPVRAKGKGQDRRLQMIVADKAYDIAANGKGLQIAGLPPALHLPSFLPYDQFKMQVTHRSPWAVGAFQLALALIIVGVGFLKANISSMVGQLYREHDPLRDSGFTLYYYGINIGAFWAAVACGALGQSVGWWAGFGLAGVGMLAGFIVFVLGGRFLQGRGLPPRPERLTQKVVGPLNVEAAILLAIVPVLLLVWLLLQHNAVVGYLLGGVSVAVLGYIAWYMATVCDRVARQKLSLALVLIAGSVVFWTLFEQANTSLSLFADRNTRLPNHGFFTVTAGQTLSLEPGFLLLFAPLAAAAWSWLGRRGREPSPLVKFGLALVQVGLGFIILVVGARYADASFRVPFLFLVAANLLHATGELCLSPVGLSEVTKLAPPALISTLMAVWFLATSWAEWIGGLVAKLTSTATLGGVALNPALGLQTFAHVFNLIGWVAVACGLLFFALSPVLRKWAHGADATEVDPDALEPS